MANIICVVELHHHRVLPVSLEVLGQARRIATALGASLYAVVPVAHAPKAGEDTFIDDLAQHGADKVILLTDEGAQADGQPDRTDTLRWGSYGPALCAVADALPPMLLLVGATLGGRDLAPRVAARLGAAYLSEAWIELEGSALSLWEGSGDAARGLDGDLEFPVVATIPPGRYAASKGDEEVEVELVQLPAHPADFEELGWEADAAGRAMVVGESAASLAAALHGTATMQGAGAPALCVSLGPSIGHLPSEVRVGLGDGAGGDVHYAVAGSIVDAEAALRQAIGTSAKEQS